jgi:hypothetical protein
MSPASFVGLIAAGALAGAFLSVIEGEPGADPPPPAMAQFEAAPRSFYAAEVQTGFTNFPGTAMEVGAAYTIAGGSGTTTFVYRTDGSVTPQ